MLFWSRFCKTALSNTNSCAILLHLMKFTWGVPGWDGNNLNLGNQLVLVAAVKVLENSIAMTNSCGILSGSCLLTST